MSNQRPNGPDPSPGDLFQEFVSKYKRLIFSRGLQFFSGNHHLAEEASQETFLRAWKYLDSYRPESGEPSNWLVTIHRNVCKDLVDVNKKFAAKLLDYEQACLQEAPPDDDEVAFKPLARLIDKLPEPYADFVWTWLDCDGDEDAVANRLRLTRGAVRAKRGRLTKVFYPLLGWGDWILAVQRHLDVVRKLHSGCSQRKRQQFLSIELQEPAPHAPQWRVFPSIEPDHPHWFPGVDAEAVIEYLHVEESLQEHGTLFANNQYWESVAEYIINSRHLHRHALWENTDVENAVDLELLAIALSQSVRDVPIHSWSRVFVVHPREFALCMRALWNDCARFYACAGLNEDERRVRTCIQPHEDTDIRQ